MIVFTQFFIQLLNIEWHKNKTIARGGSGVGRVRRLKLVLLDRNLAFNSDAAKNY